MMTATHLLVTVNLTIRLACVKARQKLLDRASVVMRIPAYKLATRNGTVYEIEDPGNWIPYENLFNFGGTPFTLNDQILLMIMLIIYLNIFKC